MATDPRSSPNLHVPEHLGFVVRIRVQGRSEGSGCLVSERHVLTCDHVVAEVPDSQLEVEVAGCERPFAVRRQVRGTTTELSMGRSVDACVLELREPVEHLEPLILAAPYSPETLQLALQGVRDVVAFGFPEGTVRCAPSTIDRVTGGQDYLDPQDVPRVLDRGIETRSLGGMSGGPVVLERDGRKVGLGLSRLGGEFVNSSVFMATGPLLELLRAAGCEPPTVALDDSFACPEPREARADFLTEQADELTSQLSFLDGEAIRADFAEKVYIALDLRGRSSTWEAGERPGTYTLEQLLAKAPESFGRPSHHWLVLGDPGSGKTTTLRTLARHCAAHEASRWTPLYLRLPRLARVLGKKGDGWRRLRDALEEEYQYDPARLALLEEERRAGRLLLLLDGWDEVQEGRERMKAWLVALARCSRGSGIVVTTRRLPADRPGTGYQEAELQPMQRADQERFLAPWIEARDPELPPCKASDWVEFFENNPPCAAWPGTLWG